MESPDRCRLPNSIIRNIYRVAILFVLCMRGVVLEAATFNGSPIVLTGSQTLTISDPDYTIKNDITLRDNSTLIISNATFMHAADYSGQFSLMAYDNSKVIIERSTIKSSPWINWYFWDNASLQMTDVTNNQSGIWTGFANQATATARNVASFHGTMSGLALIDVDGAQETFIELVFPPRSTVDASLPSEVGSTAYVFPDAAQRGITYGLRLANVGSTQWGISYHPESDITIRDARALTVTFAIPSTYSGLTAQFDNLKAKYYADASWTTGNSILRLKNTTTNPWSPIVSGNNRLIVTNSELADQSGSQNQASISISDSSMTFTKARDLVHIDIARSIVTGDVVASDNSVVTITDSGVSGRLIQEGAGRIVTTRVFGLSKGFVLSGGKLTTDPSEVISGRASIKGSFFGSAPFSSILNSDPNVIRLSANQTYRVSFKYRILAAASKEFDVSFLSNKGIAAGYFLPPLTINGKDGDTGTGALTAKLGPYDDYSVSWGLAGTGALVIDDIQFIDVATGQVIASENGESPVVVEPAPCPAGGGALTILPTTLPPLTVGVPVSIPLTVVGGTGAGWVFSANSVGQPIPGLLINTPRPGMLSGTPTTAGPYLRGFTVTDSGGNSGSVVYCGAVLPAGTRSSVDISLAVGAAGSTSTLGSSGTLQAGFAKATVNSGNAPYGTAVFSVAQNNVIVSEAGVPASPPTTSARVFIDFRSGVVNTGVALVNPGSFAANITYTLREASGQIVVTGHGSLTASTHVAKFIDQLVDIAPDFNLPADFPTTTQFGSLELSSDQPVSVVALRLTTNQRGETLLTTTPIADMTKPSSTGPTYFPQFVDGGGYTTTIVLLNTSNVVETGELRLFDDNGAPLAVRRTGGSFGSSFTYSIQPGGIFLFLTDGSAAAAHVGSVQLIPNSGNPTPAGAGVFSFSRAGVLVSESGVPSATPTTHARIFVDASNGHDTGLAISSVDGMGATVTLQAFQLDGATSTGSNRGPILLSANGHRAAFVEELISGLPSNFTGVLDISSTAPFSALTLRSLTNSRGEFLMTTFPVADFLRPAPSPVIFPQIANGGGYSTQFILLSAGGATTATLNYYDDAGNALPVGRQ